MTANIVSFKNYPPPPPPPKSNMPMLYYGLVVVATAAVVLAMYNLVVVRWCSRRQGRPGRTTPPHRFVEVTDQSQSLENVNRNLLASFKYRKEGDSAKDTEGGDYECAVCLSVFEEGEEVRRLPSCKHSFHADCIDMWLYSHSDCPLCRAHVDLPLPCQHNCTQHSREGLLHV